MMALPVKSLMKLLYPNLVRVDEYLVKTEEFDTKKRLPLTAQSLDTRGLYIFDDGFRFVIWFGSSLSPGIITNLLGEDSAIDLSKVNLSPRDNKMSNKLMEILHQYRESDL